jgi:hypothetical protein
VAIASQQLRHSSFVGDAIQENAGFALEHLDWLKTPELSHQLAVELVRRGAQLDFDVMYGSTEWRTYLASHATFLSLADGDLRDQVQTALARSEQAFIARIASGWELFAGLLGYRLRAESNADYETIARLLSATIRGLIIVALSTPDIAMTRNRASLFGATDAADWSLAATGIAAIALAFLEPDPTIEWDDERLRQLRQALETALSDDA